MGYKIRLYYVLIHPFILGNGSVIIPTSIVIEHELRSHAKPHCLETKLKIVYPSK